jgi:tripartite-type tricarboxylate transporter receptor subunit TctC
MLFAAVHQSGFWREAGDGGRLVMMNVLRPLVTRIGWAMALIAVASLAWAEEFPARPVKIIVQTAAGSSLDVMARLVTEQLAQIWGQQPIVVNQAGAGGLLAARATAASTPDGYTLFMAGGSVFVVLPEVQRNLAFDVNEFVPIGFIAEQPYALLASNKLGVNSVPELVVLSQKQPGGLDSVAGTRGGLQHLTVEWFRKRSGANLNMIHYPGPAQALNDVITGRVPVMMQTILPVAGVIASGEIKLLAIASAARLPNYPDTPTIAENVPGFTSSGWSILVAPHGTPPPVVQKINDDLRTALARPALIRKFEELGNYTRPMTPQQLSDFVRSERELWGPIVKQIGIAAQ